VKIAIVRERAHGEIDRIASADVRIPNVRRVLAVLHPDTLLDERIAERERPHGHRAVGFEAFDRGVAVRIDRAVPIPIARERVRAAPVTRDFIDVRNEQTAGDRRCERGDEQAVVTPRAQARDRPACEPAEAVGHQPLATFGNGKFRTQRTAENSTLHECDIPVGLA
jgi:hypothetical protein